MYYGGSRPGRKLSLETRRKMSESRKGAKNPNFGVVMSLEQRKKISKARMGYKYPKEVTAKWGLNRSWINNPAWRGGIVRKKVGYTIVYSPDHPFCDKQGYVRENRLVMEKHIGRYLRPEEVVHHKGIRYPIKSVENRRDNRIANLQLFKDNAAHRKFHKGLT